MVVVVEAAAALALTIKQVELEPPIKDLMGVVLELPFKAQVVEALEPQAGM